MIRPEDWVPSDGLKLEPNALRATKEQVRCLALTAGPGAGKTEMLAQRADFLLRTSCCCYPKRILAISFKVDASRNLKDRVKRRCGQNLADRFDSHTFHAFAKRIIDRFRPVLTGLDALDVDYTIGDKKVARKQVEFGDLVPLAIQILKNSVVARNAIRSTYSDVFLDEFQDCTDKQYQLIKLAFQGTTIRLTAVGDTKQRIMGWAGALEGVFTNFATDFNALPLNMYRNFRSKSRLLSMQNEIIKVMDSSALRSDELIIGNEGEIHSWEFESSQQEAAYLAELIANWINNENVPHAEIAILVSKQLDIYAFYLMAELESQGIPYRNEQQLQDISSEPLTKLIVDYLLLVHGKREPHAWIRLMDLLIPFSDEDEQIVLRGNWKQFITSERKQLAELDNEFATKWKSVDKFLGEISIDTLTALSSDYESRKRLDEVLDQTKTRIEELLKIDADLPSVLSRFRDDQAVRILTIHKSKGLEFDSVIILGVEKETFWGESDDERCAFFVGISRAKRRLVLTYSKQREKPPNVSGRWSEQRTPHEEFFAYALPFIGESE